jgi:signal peptidase I
VYGFIPRDEIVGSAKTVVLSLDYDDYYIPRMDRFFRPL